MKKILKIEKFSRKLVARICWGTTAGGASVAIAISGNYYGEEKDFVVIHQNASKLSGNMRK
jgi:hypothetical protein